MECGAGFTYDADTNLTGAEALRFTFQAAASNGLTVVRTFGHGHDAFKSIVLQPRAGAQSHVDAYVLVHYLFNMQTEYASLPAGSSSVFRISTVFQLAAPL